MDEERGSGRPEDAAAGDDGTATVLWAMLTSFTEALAGLEQRLADIEAAVRAGPPGAVDRTDDPDRVAQALQRHEELVGQRIAPLVAGVESLRVLLQAHVDETRHSLGRRAGDAGRRLASDLGLLGRGGQASPSAEGRDPGKGRRTAVED